MQPLPAQARTDIRNPCMYPLEAQVIQRKLCHQFSAPRTEPVPISPAHHTHLAKSILLLLLKLGHDVTAARELDRVQDKQLYNAVKLLYRRF